MQSSADTPEISADPQALADPQELAAEPARGAAEPARGATEPARGATEQRVPAPREAEPTRDAAPTTDRPDPDLTDREQQILSFERQWWKHAGAKEQAIRDTFGLSATRYYQLLNGLLDNPAAMTYDAALVARLRRLRTARARTRRR